jgi:hypothetical protein
LQEKIQLTRVAVCQAGTIQLEQMGTKVNKRWSKRFCLTSLTPQPLQVENGGWDEGARPSGRFHWARPEVIEHRTVFHVEAA